MQQQRRSVASLSVLALLLVGMVDAGASPGSGDSPSWSAVAGVFEPRPLSEDVYEVQTPDVDPAVQQHYVPAGDGVDLFVKTYLPRAKQGGPLPPAHVPTVLVATPYEGLQSQEDGHAADHRALADFLVPYGYAVAIAHLRGSGRSGGCYTLGGPREQEDVARIVEYLGRDARWSNGRVGMYGLSSDATSQLAVATSADMERTQYLKAIVPIAAIRTPYEMTALGGVPVAPFGVTQWAFHARMGQPEAAVRPEPRAAAEPEALAGLPRRSDCAVTGPREDGVDGSWSPWYEERDIRASAHRLTVPTLFAQGLLDPNTTPLQDVGLWERVPRTTPVAGVVGQWEHFYPERHALNAQWQRTDWLDMVRAWYDRWLLDLPVAVEDWPRVQVQDTDGRWREEPSWPDTSGERGALLLGPGGTLGAAQPEGSTTYAELSTVDTGGVAFTTAPLSGPLHLTGQPELSLWVTLAAPDAHVGVQLEALAPDGRSLLATEVVGARSAQHLDPLDRGRFTQSQPRPAPVGTPINVIVPLTPLDVRIPAGGILRVRVAGSTHFPSGAGRGRTRPSGLPTSVRVLHDCTHPSTLTFGLLHRPTRWLNVHETDEPRPLTRPDVRARGQVEDGDGTATRRSCRS